jgi:hypothetical protein
MAVAHFVFVSVIMEHVPVHGHNRSVRALAISAFKFVLDGGRDFVFETSGPEHSAALRD